VRRSTDKKIFVIGDVMLDRYIYGTTTRLSPEAPVPVVDISRESHSLGGAGNVYQNLKALGARVALFGVVGADLQGKLVKDLVVGEPVGLQISRSKPTTTKTRIVARQQQLIRLDREDRSEIEWEAREAIKSYVISNCKDVDGIVFSDYNKGVVTDALVTPILELAKKRDIPVFVDTKRKDVSLFNPITFITPNHVELGRVTFWDERPCETEEEIRRGVERLFKAIDTKYVIVKRGENGTMSFEKRKDKVVSFRALVQTRKVYDVTGAGDTVLAVVVLTYLMGYSIEEITKFANKAGGMVVEKMGTAQVKKEELFNLEKEKESK